MTASTRLLPRVALLPDRVEQLVAADEALALLEQVAERAILERAQGL